jgi:hypothetical protein
VTQAQIDKICNAAVNDPTINYTTYFKNFTSAYENYSGQISNYTSQVVSILTPADSNDSVSNYSFILIFLMFYFSKFKIKFQKIAKKF